MCDSKSSVHKILSCVGSSMTYTVKEKQKGIYLRFNDFNNPTDNSWQTFGNSLMTRHQMSSNDIRCHQITSDVIKWHLISFNQHKLCDGLSLIWSRHFIPYSDMSNDVIIGNHYITYISCKIFGKILGYSDYHQKKYW